PVLRPEELNAATARRSGVVARHEEGDALIDQLLHAIAVAAGRGIVPAELRLQFGDQRSRIGRIRPLRRDNGMIGFHRVQIIFDTPRGIGSHPTYSPGAMPAKWEEWPAWQRPSAADRRQGRPGEEA